MARPRKDAPPDQFIAAEMALAVGISARNFGLLAERHVFRPSGSGYDAAQLARLALAAAIHHAGCELILSARLAHAIADEHEGRHPELPSNLGSFLQRPFNPCPGYHPWPMQEGESNADLRLEEAFWLHRALITRSSIYKRQTAIVGDVILEVADQQYVFLDVLQAINSHQAIKWRPSLREGVGADPAYRILGWETGSAAVIRSIHDEADGNPYADPQARKRYMVFEEEFRAARNNAVALLRVNISLAIRNAFDTIHDHRIDSAAGAA